MGRMCSCRYRVHNPICLCGQPGNHLTTHGSLAFHRVAALPFLPVMKQSLPCDGNLKWWARRDSNPRPNACKASALTTAPLAQPVLISRCVPEDDTHLTTMKTRTAASAKPPETQSFKIASRGLGLLHSSCGHKLWLTGEAARHRGGTMPAGTRAASSFEFKHSDTSCRERELRKTTRVSQRPVCGSR